MREIEPQKTKRTRLNMLSWRDAQNDRRETRGRQKGSFHIRFHIHERLLDDARAAQHARRHPSRSVSIYAIANCHRGRTSKADTAHAENHSRLYIWWMRNKIAIQRLYRKQEDDGADAIVSKNNGNNS